MIQVNISIYSQIVKNFLIFVPRLADGPSWTWIILNLLPIESHLQYSALTSQSFRTRLQMINDTIDFLLTQQQQQTAVSVTDDES